MASRVRALRCGQRHLRRGAPGGDLPALDQERLRRRFTLGGDERPAGDGEHHPAGGEAGAPAGAVLRHGRLEAAQQPPDAASAAVWIPLAMASGGAPVADVDGPLHADQGGPADLGVVQAPGHGAEGGAQHGPGQAVAQLAPGRLAHQVEDQLLDAFGGLEHHVARKAVADGHVHLPVGDVLALHVAHEVKSAGFQEGVRRLHQGVAFGLFLAVADQSHPGAPHAEDVLHVHRPQLGELQQVGRLAVRGGPGVHQEAAPRREGQDGPDGGPVHALDAVEDEDQRRPSSLRCCRRSRRRRPVLP